MPPIDYVPIWQDPLRNLSMAFLPAITVGYRYAAVTMRMTRSAMLEVLREDYIRTARAKGLIEKLIVNRHALKNALLPVVTLIGIEFAFLIGGLVVTEQVFNLNGIGRLFVQAVQNQDYTLTQALVMLTVAVFVLSNLVVDLLYAWLDPRIRYRVRRPRHGRPPSAHRPDRRCRADDAVELKRSPLAAPRCSFCRREPLGTFGLRDRAGHARSTGLSAELIAPYSPTANDFAAMTEAPSWAHLLGTDQFGRDLLSRIVFGARTALIVGLRRRPSSAASSAWCWASASAYFGGWFDLIFQRVLRRADGLPADHHGAGRGGDLRHRRAQRHRRHHHPADPALRARRALERAGDPRGALCRCRARLRLQPRAHHPAPHGAQRDGAVPDHADRRSSARRSWPRRRCPISASACRSRCRPGA